MLPTKPVNLLDLNAEQVRKWLLSIETVLVDCDGVLWHDNDPIPNAPAAVNALKALGKSIYFVTNNGTKTRHELWQRAAAMGYDIDESHIIAPTHSIAEYLKERGFQEKVYVIGNEAIAKELDSINVECFGIGPDLLHDLDDYVEMLQNHKDYQNVGAVIVSFDEHFTYGKMMKALYILDHNPKCLFLATNSDAVQKFPQYIIPGTGAILSGLEICSNRKALLMGKPNPEVCQSLIDHGLLKPERTLMIGDCYKVDVVFGKNCGFQTLLVGTGRYQWKDIEDILLDTDAKENLQLLPDAFVPSLADLLSYI